MQYGHCVVNATANAINSLYLTGIAPAAMAALSNAQNAFIPSGALASIFFNWPRFFMSYTAHLLVGRRMLQCATASGKLAFHSRGSLPRAAPVAHWLLSGYSLECCSQKR